MSIAKELRKIADRLDQPGAASARRLRVSLNQYHVFERVRKIGPVKNVLDVGANKGEMVRTFARAFPESHLHAFEPLPMCQPGLKALKRDLPQLTIHQMALGNEIGEVKMFQNDYAPSSSLLPMLDRHRQLWPKTANDKPITVTMDTLDGVARCEGIVGPCILKLEV
jgi:FkbM family methyltransferase